MQYQGRVKCVARSPRFQHRAVGIGFGGGGRGGRGVLTTQLASADAAGIGFGGGGGGRRGVLTTQLAAADAAGAGAGTSAGTRGCRRTRDATLEAVETLFDLVTFTDLDGLNLALGQSRGDADDLGQRTGIDDLAFLGPAVGCDLGGRTSVRSYGFGLGSTSGTGARDTRAITQVSAGFGLGGGDNAGIAGRGGGSFSVEIAVLGLADQRGGFLFDDNRSLGDGLGGGGSHLSGVCLGFGLGGGGG